MIKVIEIPQNADMKVSYTHDSDVLTVKMDGIMETFDFTGFDEGIAEEIIPEKLPTNSIVCAEKTGDVLTVTVLRFYGVDEKHLFEGGEVNEN